MPNIVDTGDRVVGPGKYMRAIVSVEPDADVAIRIHMFNHVKLKGFHGGMTASLSDASGKLLYVSPPISSWVEGEWMSMIGESDKWIEKEYPLPAGVAEKVDRIDVWVAWTPKPGFFAEQVQRFINETLPVKPAVHDLIKWLEQKFGAPAKTEAGLAADEPMPLRASRASGLSQPRA